MFDPQQQKELNEIQTNIKAAMDDLQKQIDELKPQPLLNQDEREFLSMVLMTYCEDSDSSKEAATNADALWDKLKREVTS